MSLTRIPAISSVVRAVQTGYVDSNTLTAGAGEEAKYLDVTIASVNINKCIMFFDGGGSAGANEPFYKAGDVESAQCTTKLTTATNLRISSPFSGDDAIGGRWTVIELY